MKRHLAVAGAACVTALAIVLLATSCLPQDPRVPSYEAERRACVPEASTADEARECMHEVDLKYGQYGRYMRDAGRGLEAGAARDAGAVTDAGDASDSGGDQ